MDRRFTFRIRRFVDEGAYVFITGRRQNELDAAVKQIGRNITGVQGDVAKLADIDNLYAAVKEQKGELDIVFANAGIGELAPIGQITEESFDEQFDVNVKGVLFTIQKALPVLRDGGAIVLNASIVSITGNPAFSVYSATKAAVRSFARTWSVDLKERKIRVNALSPGVVPTPGYNTGLGMTQEQVEQFVKSMAANVRASSEDIIGVVLQVPIQKLGRSVSSASVSISDTIRSNVPHPR